MASITPENKQLPPSEAGESPNTDTLVQIKSPLSADTSPPHSTPQPERGEPRSEDTQDMEIDGGKEIDKVEGFLANIGWYEVEHAYASKPPSPSAYRVEPASNDILGATLGVPGSEAAEKKLELDATQVSTVKSMEVAMGVLDAVVVSEDGLSRRRAGVPTSPAREGVKSPLADEAKDSEGSLNEEKMEAGHVKAPERPEESVKKELKETLPAPQDPDGKEHPMEKEAAVDLEREKETETTLVKGSVTSPKPDHSAKGRAQTPEIDVESLASSPLAQDDEGEGPSEGVSASSRRRNRSKQGRRRDRKDRERARRRAHKGEQEGAGSDRPVKIEEHTPSKDEEDEGHGEEGDDKDTPNRPDKVSRTCNITMSYRLIAT